MAVQMSTTLCGKALKKLQDKFTQRTLTIEELQNFDRYCISMAEATYNRYQDCVRSLIDSPLTPEKLNELEKLYQENFAARYAIPDIYVLEQRVQNPENFLWREFSQIPTENEIKPLHRNL